MENQDVYTAAQESWLDGQYSELFKAFSTKDWKTAEMIIAEVQANEFEKVVEDMKQLLAQKKLHHA